MNDGTSVVVSGAEVRIILHLSLSLSLNLTANLAAAQDGT